MTRRLRFALFVAPVLPLALSLAMARNDSPESPSDARSPAREADAPASEQRKTPLQKHMRVKLAAADLILEGLVTEKFRLIQRGAEQFRRTSEADQWRASNDAMYRQFSREFQTRVQALDQAAQDKNLDRAALAWVDTTLNCVECHKWVNAMLIADLTPLRRVGQHAIPGHGLEATLAAHRARELAITLAAATITATPHDEPADDQAAPDRPQPARPEPGAEERDPEQRVSRFMREKLDSAQKVLEGVLIEDFELVKQGARRMSIMSQAAQWHVFDTPTYREDSAEFRTKCRQLLKAADGQRTDAAALSYLQLTLSCVRCHQHIRQKRVAINGPHNGTVDVAGIDR